MAQPKPDPPGDLPLPPLDFERYSLPLINTSQQCFRIHLAKHSPLYFGSTGISRFTAPHEEFGILYTAQEIFGAFVETFVRASLGIRLSYAEINQYQVSIIQAQAVKLLDLRGPGLAQLGLDGRLTSGNYTIARQWSLAFWKHPEQVDGLCYHCRHDMTQFGVPFYERAKHKIAVVDATRLSEHPQFMECFTRYQPKII